MASVSTLAYTVALPELYGLVNAFSSLSASVGVAWYVTTTPVCAPMTTASASVSVKSAVSKPWSHASSTAGDASGKLLFRRTTSSKSVQVPFVNVHRNVMSWSKGTLVTVVVSE